MEDLNNAIAKFLHHSVVVNIHSNPQFSVETFLALIVAVINFLLVLEINVIFENATAPTRIRISGTIKGSSSKESYCTTLSKVQGYYNRSLISSLRKSEKNTYSASNYGGWLLPQYDGDTFMKKFLADHKPKLDRIEYMLSITPSEYIRRDKEKRIQASQVRACIRSLTKMLETRDDDKVPKDMIQKNLDVMQERLNILATTDPARFIMRETECMDETLYDLMESLVLSSTLENPLPHRNLRKYPPMVRNIKEFALPKFDNNKQSTSQITLGESIGACQEKQPEADEIKSELSDEDELCQYELARENGLNLTQQQPVPIMV